MPGPQPGQFRNADSSLNREAMQAAQDSPEAQARRAQWTKDQAKVEAQTNQQVLKVLTRNQRANLERMKGPAFDRAKLNPGDNGPGGPLGFAGPAGPAGAASGGNATTSTTPTKGRTATNPAPGTAQTRAGTAKKTSGLARPRRPPADARDR
jgi:hypothetical protein